MSIKILGVEEAQNLAKHKPESDDLKDQIRMTINRKIRETTDLERTTSRTWMRIPSSLSIVNYRRSESSEYEAKKVDVRELRWLVDELRENGYKVEHNLDDPPSYNHGLIMGGLRHIEMMFRGQTTPDYEIRVFWGLKHLDWERWIGKKKEKDRGYTLSALEREWGPVQQGKNDG